MAEKKFSIATTLPLGRSEDHIPVRTRDSSILQNVETVKMQFGEWLQIYGRGFT
jgi:hypothetical protein